MAAESPKSSPNPWIMEGIHAALDDDNANGMRRKITDPTKLKRMPKRKVKQFLTRRKLSFRRKIGSKKRRSY